MNNRWVMRMHKEKSLTNVCAVQGQKEENGDFFPFTRLVIRVESETTPRSARILG